MKSFIIVLTILFGVLQYKLWFEKGGAMQVRALQNTIAQQQKQNTELSARNSALLAEIKNLKAGQDAVEERARNDLGMIKPGETFYQIVNIPTQNK